MSLLPRATWLVLAIFLSSGCSRKPERVPVADDLRAAQKAMSINEVSLMLRSGYKDQAIIPEVARRRIPAKPDAQTENALIRSGANVALIQALKTDSNVLTANQKEAYDYLAAKLASRAEEERLAQQDEPVVQGDESQKKPGAVEQTLQNLRKADAYKTQKAALETRIASQEAHIFLLRRNGYSDSQLLEYNEKLERDREQLHDLKLPLP